MATDRQLELLLKVLLAEARPVPSKPGGPQPGPHTEHPAPRFTHRRRGHEK